MSGRPLAIVGGGYSGTLLALQLLRLSDAQVTLIERTPRVARGVAYSTARPEHLLNVRAGSMSAFADAPAHFADWLTARGEGDGASFAQRRTYGAYLSGLFEAAAGRIALVREEAVAVEPGTVLLRSGKRVPADATILAIGNLPPETPRVFAAFGDVYCGDPWAGDLAEGLSDADTVLLIGTGLTAIDAALTLDGSGFRGRIVALSRRGLVPRAHAAPAPPPALAQQPPASASSLVRFVRDQAEAIGWRAAVDQLRPGTPAMWGAAGVAERRRFLRHLRPWWDVHRHRIAPEIAERIASMEAEGRLVFAAGKIVSAEAADGAAVVGWRPRGAAAAERLRVRRIVNCTGPQTDIARAGEPLLDSLLAAGRIRPDPLRIGIDVDAECRVLHAEGKADERLFAIGPMTRGAFWEIVAVPDIRRQVQQVAALVAG